MSISDGGQSRVAFLLAALSSLFVANTYAKMPADPDLSQCDNCDIFPKAWLHADADALLDLSAMAPERRLDFLIGEWELFFPTDGPNIQLTMTEPIASDIFSWFMPETVIDGIQEWRTTSSDQIPFRARTDFRYLADEDRWQMTWLTPSATGFYTGGYEGDGVFALYENQPTGDRTTLSLKPGMKYVFRNITENEFLAEEWNTADGGATYPILKWRVLYRRRAK